MRPAGPGCNRLNRSISNYIVVTCQADTPCDKSFLWGNCSHCDQQWLRSFVGRPKTPAIGEGWPVIAVPTKGLPRAIVPPEAPHPVTGRCRGLLPCGARHADRPG